MQIFFEKTNSPPLLVRLLSHNELSTEIDTKVGINGTCVIVGIATWADAGGTTLLESESISKQDCIKCVNFLFLKPIFRIIENNV